VSLFDVSDPAKPSRISNMTVGNGSSSDVEFDPHAFLWWDPLKLAVLPVQIYDYNSDSNQQKPPFTGAIGFHATKADGVTEAGRATHPADQYGYAPPVSRSLVVGDRLFTISSAGALASDLASFSDKGFVAFPVPAPQSGSGGSGTGTVEPGQTVSSPPAASSPPTK
jgi:hypothetical protein